MSPLEGGYARAFSYRIWGILVQAMNSELRTDSDQCSVNTPHPD